MFDRAAGSCSKHSINGHDSHASLNRWTVLTMDATKHAGHRMRPAPEEPPSRWWTSELSRLGKIVGTRVTNSAVATAAAHNNFRVVGLFRSIKNLQVHVFRVNGKWDYTFWPEIATSWIFWYCLPLIFVLFCLIHNCSCLDSVHGMY